MGAHIEFLCRSSVRLWLLFHKNACEAWRPKYLFVFFIFYRSKMSWQHDIHQLMFSDIRYALKWDSTSCGRPTGWHTWAPCAPPSPVSLEIFHGESEGIRQHVEIAVHFFRPLLENILLVKWSHMAETSVESWGQKSHTEWEGTAKLWGPGRGEEGGPIVNTVPGWDGVAADSCPFWASQEPKDPCYRVKMLASQIHSSYRKCGSQK